MMQVRARRQEQADPQTPTPPHSHTAWGGGGGKSARSGGAALTFRTNHDPTSLVSTRVQLAEAIDRVLHKGAVLRGDVVISVADVDLLFLDLRIVLSAVDTAMKSGILSEDGPARAPTLHASHPDADDE